MVTAVAALAVTAGVAAHVAVVNVVVGGLVAWVLARYRFPGRSLVDAIGVTSTFAGGALVAMR